jgi:hypothetical protein
MLTPAGVNDHGDAVGWVMLDHPVVDWTAAWFADDNWEMTTLDAANYFAFEIDDTGLVISKSRIWRADGTLVREYATGVELADLDDGKVGVVVGHGPAGATMWRRTSATVLPPPRA